jgi:hypothetical protein
MVAELDVYRTARVLIRQHGANAPIHAAMSPAAMQRDALLERGHLGSVCLKTGAAAGDVLLTTERSDEKSSNEAVPRRYADSDGRRSRSILHP